MLEALLSKYEKTKFPFFALNILQYENIWDKEEAKYLYEKGIINIRRGASNKIIELIINKAYEEIHENRSE